MKEITVYEMNAGFVKAIKIKAEKCLPDMARGRFNFYIHEDIEDAAFWTITEETSGAAIAKAASRKTAFKIARLNLSRVSLEAFEKLVNDFIQIRHEAKDKEINDPLWLALATCGHVFTSEELSEITAELIQSGYEVKPIAKL